MQRPQEPAVRARLVGGQLGAWWTHLPLHQHFRTDGSKLHLLASVRVSFRHAIERSTRRSFPEHRGRRPGKLSYSLLRFFRDVTDLKNLFIRPSLMVSNLRSAPLSWALVLCLPCGWYLSQGPTREQIPLLTSFNSRRLTLDP